jgi:hypothetical protein
VDFRSRRVGRVCGATRGLKTGGGKPAGFVCTLSDGVPTNGVLRNAPPGKRVHAPRSVTHVPGRARMETPYTPRVFARYGHTVKCKSSWECGAGIPACAARFGSLQNADRNVCATLAATRNLGLWAPPTFESSDACLSTFPLVGRFYFLSIMSGQLMKARCQPRNGIPYHCKRLIANNLRKMWFSMGLCSMPGSSATSSRDSRKNPEFWGSPAQKNC